MRLIVGLGNPGERYRRTRHNVGFMVLDCLAARAGVRRGREEAEAWISEADVAGERVVLAKPLTFMNRSGVAVDRLLSLKGAGPGDLLVVPDDADLELGVLRIRERGSHGGHNGLRSIIEVLGTDEFARLRVGVGRDGGQRTWPATCCRRSPRKTSWWSRRRWAWAADAAECLVREGVVSRHEPLQRPPSGRDYNRRRRRRRRSRRSQRP